MTQQQFIHNKTTAKVSLIDGSILIPVGGKVPVGPNHVIKPDALTHTDVLHAKRLNWISIEDEKSNTPTPIASSPITFTPDPMQGSTTIPTVVKKEEATSTPIGRKEEEVEEVVEETEVKAEKKPKAKAKVEA
jgi:hypothetical protein